MTEKSLTDADSHGIDADLREHYLRVTDRVEEVRSRCGITYPITICAASKTVSPQRINQAARLGLKCIGENRVQELTDKFDSIDPSLEKHFIGHLQSNKIKYLVGKVSMIQSLDSLSAARELQRLCEQRNETMRALVEINIGREPNKGGVMPEDVASFLDELEPYRRISVCGAMTICPICEKKDEYRKFFAETYQIFIDIFSKKLHNIDNLYLSMGMSDNYDLALEYGANIIRPGRALFGDRNYRQ